jgi:hypothetical protein
MHVLTPPHTQALAFLDELLNIIMDASHHKLSTNTQKQNSILPVNSNCVPLCLLRPESETRNINVQITQTRETQK